MDANCLNFYIIGEFEFHDWNDILDPVIRTGFKKNQIRIYHVEPYCYNIFPNACYFYGLPGHGRFAIYFL